MSKNMNYEVTLKEAQERFSKKDLASIAELSGAVLNPDGALELCFLGQVYRVTPDGKVSLANDTQEVGLTAKILLLHYLAQAQGIPVRDKLISFKELPGGTIYIEPFTNRAIRPLVSLFGENPSELLTTGKKLGGEPAALGDISITVRALPNVPVTLVLWAGDDEFPPSGNILFDISAPHFLPTEDYAVLASLLVYELKSLKTNIC